MIPGKKGRGVPVLIIEEMNEAIQLLLDSKEAVGVQSSEYVFTSASGVALRDYDSLKLLAKTCGAKNPDVLTSTKLRKHVATVSQVLNLRDNELDHLANFLGHDVRVHWDFCRIPDSCTQVTKISKLMFCPPLSIFCDISQNHKRIIASLYIIPVMNLAHPVKRKTCWL